MGKAAGSLPVQLAAGVCRFERWRKSRRVGCRIPEQLWELATRLGGEYGVHRTARALRLDYYDLKERVQCGARHEEEVPAFVEVVAPGAVPSRECTVELEGVGGVTMRISLSGATAEDLAVLGQLLWDQRS